MKHIKQGFLFFLLIICAFPAFSNNDYVPGTVYVSDDNLYMKGSFNVRYNPAATSSGQIGFTVSPGEYVLLSGNDSTNGRAYGCAYSPDIDPVVYQQLERLAISANNGAMITSRRYPTYPVPGTGLQRCRFITIDTSSEYLD